MDQKSAKVQVPMREKWGQIKQLLGSRMMIGVYIGQYCINALTYFFITWFPVYLVQARGMSILKAGFIASIPAICGFVGGVLGGVISDWLMRRTGSLNIARKTPIVLGCCSLPSWCSVTTWTPNGWWWALWRRHSSGKASARWAGR